MDFITSLNFSAFVGALKCLKLLQKLSWSFGRITACTMDQHESLCFHFKLRTVEKAKFTTNNSCASLQMDKLPMRTRLPR